MQLSPVPPAPAASGRDPDGAPAAWTHNEGMEYRTAHRRLENHELVVGAVLLLAFVVAVILMFVHPTASLTVFAISLVGLVLAVIVGKGLARAERTAARKSLAEGVCPNCGAAVHTGDNPQQLHCDACEIEFSERGVIVR